MARWGDIQFAFYKARKSENGRITVAVVDFLRELRAYGHDWSPNQAVEYIRQYHSTWKIKTEGEYGLHVYYQFARGITLT